MIIFKILAMIIEVKRFISFLFFVILSIQIQAQVGDKIGNYNVVWESPSLDATGQMPLGNGDIAAGVYAISDGDLYLLLSKNDAFTKLLLRGFIPVMQLACFWEEFVIHSEKRFFFNIFRK